MKRLSGNGTSYLITLKKWDFVVEGSIFQKLRAFFFTFVFVNIFKLDIVQNFAFAYRYIFVYYSVKRYIQI